MEGNEYILFLLLGLAVILGIVGSIAYYFARYGFKGDHGAAEQTSAPKPSSVTEPVRAKSLDETLVKTKATLWGRVERLFSGGTLPEKLRDELEEILYTSDLGVVTVEKLMIEINGRLKGRELSDPSLVRQALRGEMLKLLLEARPESVHELGAVFNKWCEVEPPLVLLVVGVNGVGKTTTIGKLSYALAQSGRKVLVAAGDTFRAAAGEQLKVWSERAEVEIFSPAGIQDPAAVAHMAVEKARSEKMDAVIIDTAGRLHTQAPLMEELKKVKRVISKIDPRSPHQTLLVLDANSGQNALVQAKEFHQALGLSGVILTKMDGTAKGGVAVSLAAELHLTPVLLGVGERVNDLLPFNANDYVDAIL